MDNKNVIAKNSVKRIKEERGKRTNKGRTKRKQSEKIVINSTISIITLKVKGLNIAITWQRFFI
jgi:hypothetical protein